VLCRVRIAFRVVVLAGMLQGCASPPAAPKHALKAADPDVPVRPASYRPVLGIYTSQRPTEPSSWRERNERVTPEQKP
jgi:hypothetical protein